MSLLKRFSKQIAVINDQRRLRSIKEEFLEALEENLEEVNALFPEEKENYSQFYPIIEEAIVKHIIKIQIPESAVMDEDSIENQLSDLKNYPVDACAALYLAEDKMSAYACLLPPINEGKEKEIGDLLERIRYSGILYGLDEEMIAKMVREKKYLYPFLIARGTEPTDGTDGVLTDYFERKKAFDMERFQGEVIDFSEEARHQIIGKGEMLCAIQHATKALNGRDVTGQVLLGKDGIDVDVKPGRNTILSHDGSYLLSKIAGIVSVEDGRFCVERMHIVKNHVSAADGVISFTEDIIIDGDVLTGSEIHVTGNIIVTGEIQGASIFAGGSIRAQKGVKGSAVSTLKSSGQIQCQVIENAVIVSEGNVYTNGILNSNVTCGGSVYVLSGRGIIVGGVVKAKNDIHAREIGNISGIKSQIFAGHISGLSESIQNTEKALKESKDTLEKLRKNVMNLKAVGDLLSFEKKEVLNQLVRQKQLYEARVEDLGKQLKVLKENSANATGGKISCLELYPVTEIGIGEKRREFHEPMSNCRIECRSGALTVFGL